MESKLSGFRYSDRSFEIEYKLGFFDGTTKDIDVEASIKNIKEMELNPPTNRKQAFKDAQIFIDGKKEFRVLVQVKDDVDIAFDIEGVEVLIGVNLVFNKKNKED